MLNFYVSYTSPNTDIYEWDAAKDKGLAKDCPGIMMNNEKMERISEKVIEKKEGMISKRNLPYKAVTSSDGSRNNLICGQMVIFVCCLKNKKNPQIQSIKNNENRIFSKR